MRNPRAFYEKCNKYTQNIEDHGQKLRAICGEAMTF